jgi:hypothetical protein
MLTLLNVELVIATLICGGFAVYFYPNAHDLWRRLRRERHARNRVHG